MNAERVEAVTCTASDSAKFLCLLQVPPCCSQVTITPDPHMAAPATMLLHVIQIHDEQCVFQLRAGCAWLNQRLKMLPVRLLCWA